MVLLKAPMQIQKNFSTWRDNMNLEEFNYLDKKIIYLDNGATTFKLKSVIDATTDYYTNYSASVHRGDYDLSLKVDLIYEQTRDIIAHFINAKDKKEVIYTSGTTASMNMVVFGFFKTVLKPGDEIILTQTEHASNILPWYKLAQEMGLVIKFAPLSDSYELTLKNLKKVITEKTKVVSIAHITNVIGDVRPLTEIGNYLHEQGIYFVVDAAQSIAHEAVDVTNMNIDFLAFSGHKMYGPTGIGILYGKKTLLEKMEPLHYGGGMNDSFDSEGFFTYKELPHKLEAGTPNIAGVIGLNKAVSFLIKTGLDNIKEHEKDLQAYCLKKMVALKNIDVYNEYTKSNNIIFNIRNIFSQDTAIYLNQFGICLRAGNHCAKIVSEVIGINNTCRITFGVYNTKKQIDHLVAALAKAERDIYENII